MNYQVMPPLSGEEYSELKSDIQKRGVMVPIEFDEDGNVLDGHHRLKIWRVGVNMGQANKSNRITTAEAAKDANIDQATVRYWIELGKLPGVYLRKKGAKRGMYLIPKPAWDRFMGRTNGD